jgi:hypothetical protein
MTAPIAATVVADVYLISAFIRREGAKPIVVRSVLGLYGWATSWRDSRGRLRQSLMRTRGGAVVEVERIALARYAGVAQ